MVKLECPCSALLLDGIARERDASAAAANGDANDRYAPDSALILSREGALPPSRRRLVHYTRLLLFSWFSVYLSVEIPIFPSQLTANQVQHSHCALITGPESHKQI